MKKIRYYLLIAAVTILSGCGKTEPDSELDEFNWCTDNEIECDLTECDDITAEDMADIIFSPDTWEFGEKQRDSLKTVYLAQARHSCDSIATALAAGGNVVNGIRMGYKRFYFSYTSRDQNGDKIVLSAFAAFAQYWLGKWRNLDQDNVYLICPYTHTKESQCATASKGGYEMSFFFSEALFIMPDGQGFGATKGTDQPYLNHNLQARQIFDAYKAAMQIYKTRYNGKFESDYHLRVIGASQGAGDAVAVHKLIDSNDKVRKESRFQYSYVACGPYSPTTTMEKYFDEGSVCYPCVLPLVVKSMLMSNRWFRQKYVEEDFYTDKYNQHKAEFDDKLTNKKLDADDFNKLLVKKLTEKDSGEEDGNDEFFTNDIKLDKIFNATVMDRSSAIYNDMMKCLRDQELTSGWSPVTKCKIFYCYQDDVVPYANSKQLMDLFGSKCEKEKVTAIGHKTACFRFMATSW